MQVLILIRLTKDYLHMNLHVIIHSFSIVPPILQKSSTRVTYVRLWLGIPCVIYTKLRDTMLWESTTWETGEHSLVSHSMSEIKHLKKHFHVHVPFALILCVLKKKSALFVGIACKYTVGCWSLTPLCFVGVLLTGYERFGDETSLESNALAHLSDVCTL